MSLEGQAAKSANGAKSELSRRSTRGDFMKFWKGALALATAITVAGCGATDDRGAEEGRSTASDGGASEAASAERNADGAKRFEGYVLPGTAVDAKAMGFTDCKVDYYAAVCRKPEAVLVGLKAPAIIRFELKDGKMPNDPAQLKYDEIEFEVPKAALKYPCEGDERKDPLLCFEPGQAVDLGRRLLAAGWKTHEWKRSHSFVNPAYEAGITMTEESSIASANGISLRYMSKADVSDAVKQIVDEEGALRSRENAASGFEQQMAK